MNALWISDVVMYSIAIDLFVVWTVMRDVVQMLCSNIFAERLDKTQANKLLLAKSTLPPKAGLAKLLIYEICANC